MVGLERHGDVVLHVERGLGVIGLGLEVHDQVILHGKDRVDVQVRVVAGVDLVDDGRVLRVGDHQVDVGGAHGRAVHEVEKDTGGTVGGQGVRSRVVAVPVELSLLVRPELAAQVVLGLVRVLEVVLAIGGGLPDIKDGAFNWGAGLHVLQDTVHVGDLAIGVGVLNDAVTQVAEGGVGGPEGAEDDIGSGGQALLGDDLVGDFIDETVDRIVSMFLFFSLSRMSFLHGHLRFKTNDVADAVALVADGSADLADGVDELNTKHPLGGSELHLTRKVMNVLDQGAQDHTSTLGGLGAHGIHDIGREVGVEAGVGRHGG